MSAMRSTSKPEEIPLSARRRLVNRPNTHKRPSSGKSNRIAKVVTLPVSPEFDDPKGRTRAAGAARRRIKGATSPHDLRKQVDIACQQQIADASIIGAAIQVCGYNQWWNTLLRIRSLSKEMKICLGPIVRNQYITALARSASGKKFGIIPERQQELLRLGKEAWDEIEPAQDSDTFNSGLGAALKLCAVANEPTALSWAIELWEWACIQSFQVNALGYSQYVGVLESYRMYDRVDRMIAESGVATWTNVVLLGSLINIAAEHRDWHRADTLWQRLVHEYGISGNSIAYSAWAKAHMLCGRPSEAAQIFDEMVSKGLEECSTTAADHLQALLIVCHSLPSPENIGRVQQALIRGECVMEQESSRHATSTWSKLKSIASRLQSRSTSVRFHDVLVEWKAKTQSSMKEWPNHQSGTKYLVYASPVKV